MLRGREVRAIGLVHGWLGLLTGLLLFVVLFTGPFVLFRDELRLWSDPSSRWRPATESELGDRMGTIVGEGEGGWYFELGEGGRALTGVAHEGRWMRVDAKSGALLPARSGLERILFSLHTLSPLPSGYNLVGGLGAALLLLSCSGLWLQLARRLVRLHEGVATGIHRRLSLGALPVFLLFGGTGAFLGLGPLYLQLQHRFFGGDPVALARSFGAVVAEAPALGEVKERHDYARVLAAAKEAIPGFSPTSLYVSRAGDRGATALVYGNAPGIRGFSGVALRVEDAAVLDRSAPGERSSSAELAAAATGLHSARFGGPLLRLLFALLALVAAATASSGLCSSLLRNGRPVLLRASVGFILGLCVATATLFAANRWLPWTLVDRPRWEAAIFWGGWAVAAAVPWVQRDLRRAAVHLLALAAALNLLAALSGLPSPGATGVGVALACLGLAFGTGAWILSRSASSSALADGNRPTWGRPDGGQRRMRDEGPLQDGCHRGD